MCVLNATCTLYIHCDRATVERIISTPPELLSERLLWDRNMSRFIRLACTFTHTSRTHTHTHIHSHTFTYTLTYTHVHTHKHTHVHCSNLSDAIFQYDIEAPPTNHRISPTPQLPPSSQTTPTSPQFGSLSCESCDYIN